MSSDSEMDSKEHHAPSTVLLKKELNQQTYRTMEESMLGTNMKEKRRGKWPIILWILMKMMGIYHHERIVRKRKCYSCYLKLVSSPSQQIPSDEEEVMVMESLCLHYEYDGPHWCLEDDGEAETLQDTAITSNCETCQMKWWNHQGEVRRYSDEEIGVSPWNHRRSKLVSAVTLLLLVICNGATWFNIWKIWGRSEEQLSFTLYASYLMCFSTYLMMIICSQIHSYCGAQIMSSLYWASTLNTRFIVKRLQLFDLEKKATGGLDLNYIVDFFLLGIIEMKRFGNETFWNSLFQHTKEIHKLQSSGVRMTLIGSILGIFLAVRVGENQDIYAFGEEYFGNCSQTNATQLLFVA